MAWWAPVPQPDPDEIPHSTILSWLEGIRDDGEVRQTAEDRTTYDVPFARLTAGLVPRWMARRRRRP